ncbi:MAG: Spo0E family sporulation regulatory protein-aspartic acid phosphatase [Clostridia bacterium]|jgi:hypothetical protein|nr:Spo0E family sporulation regulatory protein-aspartic acid phosphatase [Clostridia bacterium]
MLKIINSFIYKKIENEKQILNRMIRDGEDYSQILKQSQKIDRLINKVFK